MEPAEECVANGLSQPNNISPLTYADLAASKMDMLDDKQRKLMNFERMAEVTWLAAISALVTNSNLKKSLLVYEGVMSASAITALGAIIANYGLRKILVESSFYNGSANCPVCAAIRGGFCQVVSGTAVPLLLSVCVNGITGVRFQSLNIPALTWSNRRQAITFWSQRMKTIKGFLYASILVNAAAGAYVAYRQSVIAARLTDSINDEEVMDLMSTNYQRLRHFSK